MNPTLYKALILLASANKPAPASKAAGRDAGLGNRTVLYPDEPVDLPDWGIAALPAMILGAAPQSCLFVSDLTIEQPEGDGDSNAGSSDDEKDESVGSVSFSLTVDSAPDPTAKITQRQITWRLAMPVTAFRQVTTNANSTPVRAPVIRTKLVLRDVVCDVELGLLEMAGITQPLLVGRDILSNRFLIRPDHDKTSSNPPSPSATLAPVPEDKPAEMASSAPLASDTGTSNQQSAATTPDMPSSTTDTGNATPTAVDEPQKAPAPSATGDSTNTVTDGGTNSSATQPAGQTGADAGSTSDSSAAGSIPTDDTTASSKPDATTGALADTTAAESPTGSNAPAPTENGTEAAATATAITAPKSDAAIDDSKADDNSQDPAATSPATVSDDASSISAAQNEDDEATSSPPPAT
ncbi:hypothetical protein SAMN02744133_11345 [Thalassospira xiamenensis M-5 = DSM 17429]|uniref:ATP-dependent zinc protease domain-containing protein n=1 Tax=Thalassospira xiamenensis M-5 = DSM 17429 TaxID=1123366 RepID=A0AB72UAY8_9PROT|nr:hypothetical protein TH3_06675 [Thalassospira xiamenensis M-5 = DSM 17429]SIT28271.1 hypothetical protein SAMN02744133_11345 [Thalassospira xiamenensis M-5 = DSM 17429]